MNVATGFACGDDADPRLAAMAVQQAMAQLSISHASAVLLFLSDEFSHDPQPAILAASRQSQCIQVTGSCCQGLFTEQGQQREGPAVAAMVFAPPFGLTLAHSPEPDDAVLCIGQDHMPATTPASGRRFGGWPGPDWQGHPLPMWCNGKLLKSPLLSLYLSGYSACLGAAHGIRLFSPPFRVTALHDSELMALDHQPALATLARELPFEARQMAHIPLHLLFATIVDGRTEGALIEGRYRLLPLLSSHPARQSITLDGVLDLDDTLIWSMLHEQASLRNFRVALDHCKTASPAPEFGILFCSGHKAGLLDHDEDQELALLRQQLPGMPFIGCYTRHELAALAGGSRILDHSTSFGLFRHHV